MRRLGLKDLLSEVTNPPKNRKKLLMALRKLLRCPVLVEPSQRLVNNANPTLSIMSSTSKGPPIAGIAFDFSEPPLLANKAGVLRDYSKRYEPIG